MYIFHDQGCQWEVVNNGIIFCGKCGVCVVHLECPSGTNTQASMGLREKNMPLECDQLSGI